MCEKIIQEAQIRCPITNRKQPPTQTKKKKTKTNKKQKEGKVSVHKRF
jgi:hypothetical protein